MEIFFFTVTDWIGFPAFGMKTARKFQSPSLFLLEIMTKKMNEIQFKDCLERISPRSARRPFSEAEHLFLHEMMFIKFTLFAFHACRPSTSHFMISWRNPAECAKSTGAPNDWFFQAGKPYEDFVFRVDCQVVPTTKEKRRHEEQGHDRDCQLISFSPGLQESN